MVSVHQNKRQKYTTLSPWLLCSKFSIKHILEMGLKPRVLLDTRPRPKGRGNWLDLFLLTPCFSLGKGTANNWGFSPTSYLLKIFKVMVEQDNPPPDTFVFPFGGTGLAPLGRGIRLPHCRRVNSI